MVDCYIRLTWLACAIDNIAEHSILHTAQWTIWMLCSFRVWWRTGNLGSPHHEAAKDQRKGREPGGEIGLSTLGFQVSNPGAGEASRASRILLRLLWMLPAVAPLDCRLEDARASRLGSTLPACTGRLSTTC